MSAPIPRIEAQTTRNFSVAYSAAPIATGLFIYAGSGSTSLVHTASTVTSDTTHFNAFVTVGNSPGMLLAYEWCASFAVGPVYHRGYCQIIKTRG